MNRTLRSITHGWMVLLCLSLLAACGGSGGGKSTPQPTASAGTAQTVTRGSTVTLDGSASTSPRSGATLSYRWTLATRPELSTAELTAATTASPSFVADLPGLYEAELVVNDGTIDSAAARVAITVTSTDPVAVAETSHSVLIGSTVALDGRRSIAPTGGDASALTYIWQLESAPAGSSAVLTQTNVGVASFYANVAGTYTATLVVRHGDKTSEPLLVTINATASNTKPVADPGGPYTVERGKPITLDGTASSDADGDTLSYRWTITLLNGSSLRTETALQGRDTATPTFTPDVVGNWNLTLTVYDGVSQSTTRSISVTVTKPEGVANTPPVASFFVSPRYDFFTPTYSDEVELGTTVWSSGNSWDVDGTYIGLGIGGSSRTYRWISTPDGYTQADLSASGSFSFTPTVAGQYTVEMSVNDGEADGVAPVRRTFIARTGANRAPNASVAADAGTVLIGQTGWFDARTSNDPDGDQLTYTWYLHDKPDGSTASLKFENVTLESGTVLRNARAGLVTDKPGAYTVWMIVTDSHGVTSTPTVIASSTILAKAKNNAPTIDYISNNNSHFSSRRENTHFNDSDQPYIVGGQALTMYMVNPVDPDMDTLYYLWTLEQPAASKLTNASVAQNYNIGVPVEPGTYTITAVASDGIAATAPYTLAFKAVTRANYPSLLLEDLHTGYQDGVAYNFADRYFWVNGAPPSPRQRAFPYWDHSDASYPLFKRQVYVGDNLVKNYRLTAFGGDYTITNLKVATPSDPGAATYSGKFAGLANGQVIKRGQTADFSLIVVSTVDGSTVTTQTANNVEGLKFTFEIAEKPGWTFEYQPYIY